MFTERNNRRRTLKMALGISTCLWPANMLSAQETAFQVVPSQELSRPLAAFHPTRLPASFVSYAGSAEAPPIATPEMLVWLETIIRRNLPPIYEDVRKWGTQKEVWDGVEIWREGNHLETKRKKKLVNAGTWTRYSITLVEPEERLFIQLNRLETLPDGRIAFAVAVECSLDIFGRLSQWARDIQLVSISANADAACRLVMEGTVKIQINPLKLPPDVSITPHVDVAHIDLTYYRVRRISQLGGDFAKVLGNGLRHVVDEKLEDMNSKLVDKINKQLDKHSDKLKFSAQDWLKSKLPVAAPKSLSASAE